MRDYNHWSNTDIIERLDKHKEESEDNKRFREMDLFEQAAIQRSHKVTLTLKQLSLLKPMIHGYYLGLFMQDSRPRLIAVLVFLTLIAIFAEAVNPVMLLCSISMIVTSTICKYWNFTAISASVHHIMDGDCYKEKITDVWYEDIYFDGVGNRRFYFVNTEGFENVPIRSLIPFMANTDIAGHIDVTLEERIKSNSLVGQDVYIFAYDDNEDGYKVSAVWVGDAEIYNSLPCAGV